ncbi:hypothetical protein FJ958_20815 [Mesorhizobium sp. B2-3-5]|nr:hypothetical protein FJ958_20815 [Mesorhizobium sp. B2-3-5]
MPGFFLKADCFRAVHRFPETANRSQFPRESAMRFSRETVFTLFLELLSRSSDRSWPSRRGRRQGPCRSADD